MVHVPLSWKEIIVIGLAVLVLVLIGLFWAGVILVIVAILGKYLGISMGNRWLMGIVGLFLIVLSLIVGRVF
jgi:hypothetical protein